ncbi:biliverdin-producing heme oxygenase [Novosphingobium olei]|uniref:biliverdin-producing heme oxygenase n=1 Tax=Novosphingobium olei TaxID=2728851 RepID=UPI00308D238A|nr:biliverdin-producing heme oxygenase [Novosphingobium olei]
MGEIRAWLRDSTRDDHARVDDAFASFRLSDRSSYADFLAAHGRALLPLERWIGAGALLPGWRGRSEAVVEDLHALAEPVPEAPALEWPRDEAARLGALYVLEGSRMGAAVLARDVSDDLPNGYLTSRAAPGQWQALLTLLESKGSEGGTPWRQRALEGASRAFALFHAAAQEVQAAYR